MNSKAALNSYTQVRRDANIETASPHRLVDMLFEGAIERIVQAKGAIQFKQIELRGKKINAAISIISGLRSNLNFDSGGELAINLDSLYEYIQNILIQAHQNSDEALLDESLTLLGELKLAWVQIASRV